MKKRVLFLLVLLFGSLLLYTLDLYLMHQQRMRDADHLERRAEAVANAITLSMEKRLTAVHDLGIVLTLNPNITNTQFMQVAESIFTLKSAMQALQFADHETKIRFVYPVEGNEKVIKNPIILLKDPKRAPFVREAIAERKMTVQMPFILRQGMLGTVARQPLFIGGHFAGLAIGVIDLERVLKEALAPAEFRELDIHLYDQAGKQFHGDNETMRDATRRSLTFGNATWTVRVAHHNKEYSPLLLTRTILWVAGSGIILLVAFALYLLRTGNERLKQSLNAISIRYRSIFDNLSEAVYVQKVGKGEERITEVNAAAVHMLGYSKEEFAKKVFSDLHKETDDGEYLLEAKDGTLIPAVVSTSSFMDGGDAYTVSIVRDVSVQRYYQQQLLERNRTLADLNATLEDRVREEIDQRMTQERMLMQQSKLAAMGEMIGAIAHQWRQPLNAIGLLVQDMHEGLTGNTMTAEESEETLQLVMDQVQYMSDTINDFRNFVTPERATAVYSVTDAVRTTIRLVKAQMDSKGITVLLRGTQNGCDHVEGRAKEFQQAVINIFNNAQQAMEEYRMQHLAETDYRPLITVDVAACGDFVNVTIFNSGGAIPRAVMDRMFEPYFTTKDPTRGTGLGLYMVKMIIEFNAHGRVHAENRDGGVAFVLQLPRVKEGGITCE